MRAIGAGAALAAIVAGLPWLLWEVTGSPIPDRLPAVEEIRWALTRRDDGTLLLGFLRYLTWGLWAAWTLLVAVEASAQLAGRSAPRLPGLSGPQQLAAFLIASLTAALVGTTLSLGRTTALPAHPSGPPADPPAPSLAVASLGVAGPDEPGTGWGAAPPRDSGPAQGPVAASAAAAVAQRRTVTIRFGFDSAELTDTAHATLVQAAHVIAAQGDVARPVVVVGHTDTRGPAPYNQQLSLRRATTVRKALQEVLGNRYQLQVNAQGEAQPIADEQHPDGRDDPTGRAANRRAEITYTLRQAAPPASPDPREPAPQLPAPTRPPTTPKPSAPSPSGGGPLVPGPPSPAPTSGSPGRSDPGTPPPSTPARPPQQGDRHEDDPVVVDLPSGAVLGVGLAVVISTAVAATRLHRRRRAPTQASRPRPSPPDESTATTAETSETSARAERVASPAVRALRRAHLARHTRTGHNPPTDAELVAADFTADPPTHLTVGARGGQEVSFALNGLAVGLTGPGALDAARAMATEMIGRARNAHLQVIVPRSAAATLVDAADLDALADAVPGLVLTADLQAALLRLEAEIVHRARLMADHHTAALDELRAADPSEPLPALIVIADVTGASDRWAGTLEAALRFGERHGVGAVLLGPWPPGTTCHIDADATVTHADGPQHELWAGTRLFHLTPTDAADLLDVIATAHGAPTPPDPARSSAPDPVADQQVLGPQQAPAQPAAAQPVPELLSLSSSVSSPAAPPPALAAGRGPRPVRLRLLGAARVDTEQGEVATGLRRTARELLALLAAHPDGITREAGMQALWPERDPQAASRQFHTAVNNARQTLRQATGLSQPMFIIHASGRYRLDPHLIDVDLWDLARALEAAAHAADDAARVAALRRVGEVYAGDLAVEVAGEWAEGERERLRRAATDGLAHLAQLLEADHPEDALAALEQAFTHDPYSEPLARTLMRTQARLGRVDAARRTHQLLSHHLADLDVDPDTETERLLATLLHQRQGRPEPTRPSPGRPQTASDPQRASGEGR